MHRLQSHCSKRINLQKPLNCKLHRSKLTVQLCTPHFRAYNIKVWYCPLDLGFRGMGSKMIKTQWDWSNRHWEITGVQGLHYDGCIVMAASCTAIVLLQQHCTACCRSIALHVAEALQQDALHAAPALQHCSIAEALQHCDSFVAEALLTGSELFLGCITCTRERGGEDTSFNDNDLESRKYKEVEKVGHLLVDL